MAILFRISGIIIIMVVMLLSIGCSGNPDAGQPPAPGGPAPDFKLKSLGGGTISLEDFKGGPVLLNLWATWCGPCRMEMPYIEEVSRDPGWAARGLTVLAVNLGDPAEAVQEFVDANGLTFTVLLDSEKKVGVLYNVQYIPTTYLIDNNGIIRHINTGAFTGKTDIDRLLMSMFVAE